MTPPRSAEETKMSVARRKLRKVVNAGLIQRPDRCSACGTEPSRARDGRTKVQGHHFKGYDHPLDVQWLCPKCHAKEHVWPSENNYMRLNPQTLAGEKNGRAKLSADQVRAIRSLLSQGAPVKRLAKEMAIPERTLRDIKTGRNWSSLLEGGRQ